MKRLVMLASGLSLLFLIGTNPAIARDGRGHDNDHRHYGWQHGWDEANERAREVRSAKHDPQPTAPSIAPAPAPVVAPPAPTAPVTMPSPVAPDPLAVPM